MQTEEDRSRALVSRTGWRTKSDKEKLDACVGSIRYTNFVSTFELTSPPIDTQSISQRLLGAQYNPVFEEVVITLLDPPATATVYSTGSVVIMGVNSDDGAALAARKIAHLVNANTRRRHYSSGEPIVHMVERIRVHNVVGTVLAFPVSVDALVHAWGNAVELHDQFMGVTLSCARLGITPSTSIVMTIYAHTGKIIITGARDRDEIPPVYAYVHRNVLQGCERKDVEFEAPAEAEDDDEDDYDEDDYEDKEDDDEDDYKSDSDASMESDESA